MHTRQQTNRYTFISAIVIKMVFTSVMILFFSSCLSETQGTKTIQTPKTAFTDNDIGSFVYSWFAIFDRTPDISVLKKFMNPNKMDWNYPGATIKNISEFENWYVNSMLKYFKAYHHILKNIKITGDDTNGYTVKFSVNFEGIPHEGDKAMMELNYEMLIRPDENNNLIIEKSRAQAIE